MTKRIVITSNEEADQLVDDVTRSADRSIRELLHRDSSAEGLRALWAMKFEPVGCDPLHAETPLNLIEQLNQTFTYLASARAVKLLIAMCPSCAPFTLNLGTSPGSDIESGQGGGLAAEVFAAVRTSNNRKLAKDIAKVSKAPVMHKYVFFMCPGIDPGRQLQLERTPGVEVWSLGGAL